ncbi:ATP-dependent Clp protease proteolytic subunit-related protein 2, chloroplastic [Selaginella moellendorffii]|nr:ATP-dependent Clp protease proteolytic subunit-related protein 2, chloroplastic [Selaginella moellendorffii]|eukprot:XP_002968834.2 ATP-dependent Clp protease proteolytic subunit-related protein 2, chloroplastic [Selaginella moellendorffii]
MATSSLALSPAKCVPSSFPPRMSLRSSSSPGGRLLGKLPALGELSHSKRGGKCRAQVVMMPLGVPKVPYRASSEGSWQYVDIWNVLYQERIVFIGQHIDDDLANRVVATMLYLDSVDSSKHLHFYISCPGGSLTPSMAIYDTMGSVRSGIATLALGAAYDIAGFLLAAGEKGMRMAMPLARIALQPPEGATRGQADDIQTEVNELGRLRDCLYEQLAINTGQPVDKIHKDLDRMKIFSAQEALDYGLIDKIVRPPKYASSSLSIGGVGPYNASF